MGLTTNRIKYRIKFKPRSSIGCYMGAMRTCRDSTDPPKRSEGRLSPAWLISALIHRIKAI